MTFCKSLSLNFVYLSSVRVSHFWGSGSMNQCESVKLPLRSLPNCKTITYAYKDYKPSLYWLEFAPIEVALVIATFFVIPCTLFICIKNLKKWPFNWNILLFLIQLMQLGLFCFLRVKVKFNYVTEYVKSFADLIALILSLLW